MRAYLLGYTHGKNDGYYSTLIKRGGYEKSYDESLDVDYISIDTALEIIDKRIKWCMQIKNHSLGKFMPDVYALTLVEQDIEALKGEQE